MNLCIEWYLKNIFADNMKQLNVFLFDVRLLQFVLSNLNKMVDNETKCNPLKLNQQTPDVKPAASIPDN